MQDAAPAARLGLLHQINLRHRAWGGMEKHFCRLLQATAMDPQIDNYLVENLHDAADEVGRHLRLLSAPAAEARRLGPLPLPKRPRWVRELRRRRLARRWRVNRVLNWNLFGDLGPLRIARSLGAAAVYWERGAAWYEQPSPPQAFADGYDLYLANSVASREMLRQRWKVRGEIRICSPGVVHPALQRGARSLRADRVLRLGFAARLRAFKGGVLAVHALGTVRAQGLQAELMVAGDGPDRLAMQQQAQRLGIGGHVHFLGSLTEMTAFFGAIDLYLHPALREPYGLAPAEALCAGVPVIAARVDGLPEVVDEGATGYCITPTRPLSGYGAFGGNIGDVYPLVYRPERGVVAEPSFVDPEALADAVVRLAGDPQRYQAMSAAALAAHARKFAFEPHLAALTQMLRALS